MRKLTVLLLALMMTACGESAPTETVESLIADPERLAELREQCRDNPAALGDELCNAVAEATRRASWAMAMCPIHRRRKNRGSDPTYLVKKMSGSSPCRSALSCAAFVRHTRRPELLHFSPCILPITVFDRH